MQEIIYLEDLPAYKEAPQFATKFADALWEFNQEEVVIEIDNHRFRGKKGISSNLQYSRYDNQLLAEDLSYTFSLPNQQLEISLQFYRNKSKHYRLFAFTRCNGEVGLAFSINLSINRVVDGKYALKNKIKFSDRIDSDPDIAKAIRKRKQEVLCDLLADLNFNISNENDVCLGVFDTTNTLDGEFINTNVNQFVHDMLTITLLKGHYMGNKGYRLDFLPLLNN